MKQRYIIIAVTGIAFLVNMFLTIATGTAYVQHFWVSVKQKPKSFDAIDNTTLFWNLEL
jgi:hypothetical protein